MLVIAGCFIALGVCIGARLLPWGSLRIFVLEIWPALLMGLASLGLGGIAMICMGLGRAAPRWRVVLGGGIGFGLLALLVLGLGSLGHLSRHLWLGIVGAAAVLGAGWVVHAAVTARLAPNPEPAGGKVAPWLWLLAMPALALALFAASFPPGILWATEGNGYDVLEYHFGAPREYFDAGKIQFLPHNIYSNFPFNVEMLYLLTFILRGTPHESAFAAQFLNVLLAGWAVAAAWLAGRTLSPLAGHMAGVLTATCPWLAWLCGVAYVENGLLMFTGLAVAAFLESVRGDASPARPVRWMIAAGLAAGLACGCKYTAGPMLAAPLGIAVLVVAIFRRKWLMPIAFVVAAALSFAPWLIKNLVYTGNPVFPLARTVFPERPDVWTPDGAARWHEGHLPDEDHRTVAGRLSAIRGEVIHRGRFGTILYAGLAAALAWPLLSRARRDSSPRLMAAYGTLLGCCACALVTWLAATHLQDRFLVPLVIPTVLLVALVLQAMPQRFQNATALVLTSGLCLAGLVRTHALFEDQYDYANYRKIPGAFTIAKAAIGEDGSYDPRQLVEAIRAGVFAGHEHVPLLIDCTERTGRVLMVGDARGFYLNSKVDYCVVFNRNPLEAAARRYRPRRVLEWLKDRGYTFIYVDWIEMNRLRNSRYGFWEPIDEAFFAKLVEAGLQPVRQVPISDRNPTPRATLFRIPEQLPQPNLRLM